MVEDSYDESPQPDFVMVWEPYQGIRIACLTCTWISARTYNKLSQIQNDAAFHVSEHH